MDNKPINNDAMMHEGKKPSDMKAGCCETKGMCDNKGGCGDMKADCCSTKMDCCTMKKGCCGSACGKKLIMIVIAIVVIGGAFMCGMRMGRGSMRHYCMDRDFNNNNMKSMYECMMTDGATREKCESTIQTMMGNQRTNNGTETN